MCFASGQNCRTPYSTLSAHSLSSGTAKCHCGDSRDELDARVGGLGIRAHEGGRERDTQRWKFKGRH